MKKKKQRVHICRIQRHPIHIKPLQVVDRMLEERVSGADSHERIVNACRDARWRNPIDSREEIERDLAFDVEIEVDSTVLVQHEIADRV